MKKKCRFFTKCCLFGTASGFIVISALLVGGFFTLKKFNEVTYEVERLSCENEKLSRELNPTELIIFNSTEKMNWFEANRVIVQIFYSLIICLYLRLLPEDRATLFSNILGPQCLWIVLPKLFT